ncbi:hypothetical protein [Paenibacillus glycanilyticus]|uniref:hypothetical protein n=1 Tax=Paenibacillus glycanilyticus TaxID=126569 RepID=UPI0024E06570|nr:hypothetical protein [Paenibacillus glycanilyticus]
MHAKIAVHVDTAFVSSIIEVTADSAYGENLRLPLILEAVLGSGARAKTSREVKASRLAAAIISISF